MHEKPRVYRKRLRHAGIKLAPKGRPLPGTFASGGSIGWMAGGKGGEIEGHAGKGRGLRFLALGKEAVGDAALIEDFDGAGVKAAGTGAGQLRAGAPFDEGEKWLRCFRIVPDPSVAEDSVSLEGDSGSLWLESASGAAVGLHVAGEDDVSPLNDYALAHPIGDVLSRLRVLLKSSKLIRNLMTDIDNSEEFGDLAEHEIMVSDAVRVDAYRAAIARYRMEGRKEPEVEALNSLGRILRLLGEFDAARATYGRALAIARAPCALRT